MPLIDDTELLGMRVITDDAADVGVLDEIYVDVYDWHVTKFDLRIEKKYADRLGLESGIMKRPSVQIKIHMVRGVGDVIHLKGGLDELKQGTKAVQPPRSPEPTAPATGETAPEKSSKKEKDRPRKEPETPKRSRASSDRSEDKPRTL